MTSPDPCPAFCCLDSFRHRADNSALMRRGILKEPEPGLTKQSLTVVSLQARNRLLSTDGKS